MTDTNFGIEEALEQAGLTAVPPEQPQAPATQPEPPIEDQTFIGEDITEYFGEADAPFADDVSETPVAQQPQQNITPEMAALIQQNQTLLQQTFAAQQKQRDDKIAELEARLAAFDKTNPAPTEKPWYETVELPELTEEQKKAYAPSMPVLEAIARKQALDIVRRMEAARIDPMSQRFQEVVQPLQETVQAQQDNLARTQQRSYQQALNTRLPWLAEAINTPAYAKYYHDIVPGTGGLTRKTLLEQAEAVGNVDAVVDLLSGFKAPATQQNQQQYTAPGRGYAINQTQQANAAQPRVKKGMKLSTYNKALQDYSNGKMSSDKFQEYQDAWNMALINETAVMD